MKYCLAFLLLILSAQADAQKWGPAITGMMSDIANTYSNAESNIEKAFEKLNKACKDDIDALNGQISILENQITALKNKANKIKDITGEDKKAKDSLRQINKNLGQLEQQQKEKQHKLIVLQQRKVKLEADKKNALDALERDRDRRTNEAMEVNNREGKRTDTKKIQNYTKALQKEVNSMVADSLRSIDTRYKPINL